MKRLIALFLMIVMLAMSVACGKDKNKPNNDEGFIGNNNTVSTSSDDKTIDASITIDSVKTAKETDASLFEFEEVEGGVAITKYLGNESIVVIPSTLDGMPVTQVEEAAFANDMEMQGLRLGDNVQFIEKNAFANCKNLMVVVFSSKVKTIGQYAFSGDSMLKDVILNDGLETMKSGCFGFTAITELMIPDSVTTVDYIFTKEAGIERCVIASIGSAAEAYVNEHGEAGFLIFKAK